MRIPPRCCGFLQKFFPGILPVVSSENSSRCSCEGFFQVFFVGINPLVLFKDSSRRITQSYFWGFLRVHVLLLRCVLSIFRMKSQLFPLRTEAQETYTILDGHGNKSIIHTWQHIRHGDQARRLRFRSHAVGCWFASTTTAIVIPPGPTRLDSLLLPRPYLEHWHHSTKTTLSWSGRVRRRWRRLAMIVDMLLSFVTRTLFASRTGLLRAARKQRHYRYTTSVQCDCGLNDGWRLELLRVWR